MALSFRSVWKFGLSCLCAGLVWSNGNPAAHAVSVCTVNTTAAQTFKGWGSFPSYFRTDWSPTHASDMFDKPEIQNAVYNMGITHIRVDIEPRLYVSGSTLSDMTLSAPALGDLVTQIQIAQSHGVTQYITSCWSPPAVWKTNGSIDGGSLVAADEASFIAYYVKVLQALQAAGVGLPVAISVQNEPDLSTSYDSCVYTYAAWRQLVEDMRTALDANGLTSVLINGPECTNTDDDIAFLGSSPNFGMMTVAAFAAALGNYASHTYGEHIFLGMRGGERSYPRDSWITEWSIAYGSSYGGTETGWTWGTMAHLASNLIDIPNNYWTWWVAWGGVSGTPSGTNLLTGGLTPTYSKRYYALQRLWTTVRPGWTVHSMTTNDTNFTVVNTANPSGQEVLVDLIGFTDPTGTSGAAMLINQTASPITMTVNHLTGTAYTAFQTDATHDMADVADGAVSGGTATITLSPTSVTIVSSTSAVPAAPATVIASPANPGATVAWPAVWGATRYDVKRSTSASGPFTSVGTAGIGATLTYQDTTAVAGTRYYYTVAAVNPSGEGANAAATGVTIPYLRVAVADTFVQDGTTPPSGAGTGPDLAVKNAGPSSPGYNRQAYLRFDVSGLANAQSVQVWLVPDGTGAKAWNDLNISFAWVSNDTWSETGLTWSTKPAPSTVFGNQTGGYYVGHAIVIDVTAQAKAQAAGDGLLSVCAYSNEVDADEWLQFGSRENATPGYRPVLAYTLADGTREAVADAYVQDGSTANTNFGSATDLPVKYVNSAGYDREAYFKFDVSGLGAAGSVLLRFMPDIVGTDADTATFSYDVTSTDSWTETGLTWNNKPASASVITTVTGYGAGTPVEIDVTPQAHTAAAGDGVLSVRVHSTLTTSGDSWVQFGSKENANTDMHPVLEY